MKATKVWVATDPFDKDNKVVRWEEPYDTEYYFDPDDWSASGVELEFKEYVLIEVQNGSL